MIRTSPNNRLLPIAIDTQPRQQLYAERVLVPSCTTFVSRKSILFASHNNLILR